MIDPYLTKLLQRALRRDPQIRIKLGDLLVELENYSNNLQRVNEISLASLNANHNFENAYEEGGY